MEISREVKLLIEKYNFKASKRLGQNFLVASSALNFIVEAINPTKDKSYIEVGPGFAFLTKAVAERAKHVYAIELDERFKPYYNENSIPNATFIIGDALRANFNDFDAQELFGNIPYYITSELIMKIARSNLKRAVLLLQDEFSRRLVSNPSLKEYGSITVFIKFFFEVRFLKRFPPSFFIPRPDVYSSLVELNRVREYKEDYEGFLRFVHSAFNKRRKKLLSTLNEIYEFDFFPIFEKFGVNENSRPENISVEEFFEIYKEFENLKTKE